MCLAKTDEIGEGDAMRAPSEGGSKELYRYKLDRMTLPRKSHASVRVHPVTVGVSSTTGSDAKLNWHEDLDTIWCEVCDGVGVGGPTTPLGEMNTCRCAYKSRRKSHNLGTKCHRAARV